MKKLFYLICCLSLANCSESTTIVNQLVDEIRSEYVPDKRIAIFDVKATAQQGIIKLKGESNLPEAKTDLLQQLKDIGIDCIDSIQLLPTESLEGKIYGVVNLSVCNIRSNPKHSAELATQSTLGTPLRVYKTENGWYSVQTPDQYLGWLDAGGFILMNQAEFDAWQQLPKVVYLKDFGFSYATPDEQTQRVSDLVAGNILALDSTGIDFSRVRYPDQRLAYIKNEHLMNYTDWLSVDSTSTERILASAQSLMGRPYLWGGTSGKGMDCSGFTKTVYYMNGLLLPRDASQQVYVGEAITLDTTWQTHKKGDFFFFGKRATEVQKERITHVAIHLGDGKIIHSSGTIRIESLNRDHSDFNEDRFNTLVRAKRMTENIGENGVQWLRDVKGY